MKKITMKIDGMSCGHCKMAVEKALNKIDGVLKAEVSLGNNNAVIEYNEAKVSSGDLKLTVEEAGYDAEI